ncbi:MAG TPA: hypothetical protein VNV85_01715 [Puia sp.]|jgi:hypothetical protein|nr:hypothetical protein [Puia sp.]
MNQHLNLFRFFNESTEMEFRENNLSRAFSICLMNNSAFLNEYIKAVVSPEDYDYLFSSVSEDTKFTLDIQIDTAEIERESFSKIYAVAMTSDRSLSMDDFFSQPDFGERKNITDIFICIKDISIIIEVKITGYDCKAQLYNQALPFIREHYNVLPVKFSWQETIKLMEKINHVQRLVSQSSTFTKDFLQLSEIRFPEWFEPKPFNVLPFSSHSGTPNYIQLTKRMRQAFSSSAYELLTYSDRLGITVPFGWANEIHAEFETYAGEVKEYVAFYIYPGNTKQQGYPIFSKPLDWLSKKSLRINNADYELEIAYNIKLCHFSKYVSGATFYEKDAINPLHTQENFKEFSGKWTRDKWDSFTQFMDEHFKKEFDWRSICKWEEEFVNTDRNYFTISLGFEVCVFVPYSYFKTIDRNEKDITSVANFVNSVAIALQTLIS